MNHNYHVSIGISIILLIIIASLPTGAEMQMNQHSSGITGKAIEVTPQHAQDRIIVRYKPDAKGPDATLNSFMDTMNRKVGGSVLADFSPMGVPGMQIVRPPDNRSAEEAIAEYANNSEVLYAEADTIIALSPDENRESVSDSSGSSTIASVTPNDPGFSLLWGLHNTGQTPFSGTADADIDAPEAWDTTVGSASVVVALVDTGVDYTHEDLAANIWTNTGEIAGNGIDDDKNGYIDDIRGWDFANTDNNPMDDHGHGTHCAGIISAVGNNKTGVAGVNWNATIMPLKFLDSSGSGYTSDAISAILYANKMGAKIISNSWGGTEYSRALKEAIDASSAVVVCAAGNDATNIDSVPLYPASYPGSNIISVAATDYKDKLASFSNYGITSVDLAAPGVKIRSTYPNNKYAYLSGTSMATPHVAGVAALVYAKNSSQSNAAVKAEILNGVDTMSSLKGKVLTGGRLNAAKAVALAGDSGGSSTDGDTTIGNLTTSFTAAPRSGNAPLPVQFQDSSSGTTAWRWNFGDGSSSSLKNPRHTYQNRGTYTVTLKSSKGTKSGTMTRSGFIVVQ
ncbi:MAG: S8 family serine peptidase [Methanospirillum sp.]|uniref:S8 family serine peptidase n=1 Tax=Methanospirillum sp. TaxID=45200 RepID=UPI0023703A81|nr:S8 family serine peptidase [Methanospirillum sp.]MDD1729779.1 S8 family serine peptidase [Methanospirillum sp.]